MKITPALPSPYQPPLSQERSAVSAVQAPGRVLDATERPGPGWPLMQPAGYADPGASRESTASRHPGHSSHASRAMALYTRVAEYGDRTSLRDLLGFDAYA